VTVVTRIASTRSRDVRLAVPAVSAWSTAGLVVGAPDQAAVVTIASVLASVVLLLLALRGPARYRGWWALAVITSAIVALAALSVGVHDAHRHPTAVDAAARDGRFIVATVEGGPRGGDDPWPVTVASVTIGGSTTATTTSALVFDGAPVAAFAPGARFTVSGTLRATAPGSSAAYLLFASGPAVPVSPAAPILDWAEGVRVGLVRAAGGLPGAGAALLPGLAIGDTRSVNVELDAAMKASSLSHLTAVSGANCAIVVAIVMAVLAGIGVPRAVRIAMSVVVLGGFVVLVTPEPSVLRAAVMATIALVSLGGGRPVSGITVLSLAVVVLIVADPWLSRSYGFALSVLATAAILLFARPLAALLSRVMPQSLALVVAVPLAAQLGCQPVLILLSPSIPLLGLFANIAAAPAAPLATVVGLAACVILPLVPWLGGTLVAIAWVPSTWIAAVAAFTSSVPGARIDWPAGAPGLLLLAVATGGALVAAFARLRPAFRVVAGSIAIATILLVGVTSGAARLAVQLARPADWRIAACDVGQGDAVVVRSGQRVALIDTGPTPERLMRCLGDLDIDRVDLLVLTHFDLDHVGGTRAVEGMTDVVLVGPSSGADDDALVRRLVDAGAQLHRVSAGTRGRLGDQDWTVLWPPANLRGIEPGNDASVVMHFDDAACRGTCLSSTFLGDLGQSSQAALVRTRRVETVDIVKVAHHGSADQDPELYDALAATVGVIGVGAENRYGHPTDILLDILATTATEAARTDERGMILLAPSGPSGITVWTERGGVGSGG